MNAPADQRLIDERAAARFLGISARTLWDMAARGEVPFLRIGGRKLYDRQRLERWIDERMAATC